MKVMLRVAALAFFVGMLVFLSCRAQTGVQSPATNARPATPERGSEMMLPASKAGPVFFRPGNPPEPGYAPSQVAPPQVAPSQAQQQAPLQSLP